MKTCLVLFSVLALALTIVPPFSAFGSGNGLSQLMKTIMLLGTLLWFASATPFAWQRRTMAADHRPGTNSH